ncbi:EAL domain-containing protein [Oscillospiraceae bacterium WX1]
MKSLLNAYITSRNDMESLRHENQMTLTITVPLLIFASLVNYVVFVLIENSNVAAAFTNSLIFLFFAVCMQIVKKLSMAQRIKYFVIIGYLMLLLVFLVIRYYIIIGPTVWTISFIMILIALARNNRLMITFVSLLLIVLGIYASVADISFVMGTEYYIAQFLAFAFLFIIASGVQYISIERHKKIISYLDESELISQVSADFISVCADNFDEKIDGMLQRLGQYLQADRAGVFSLSSDAKTLTCAYEWCSKELENISSKPIDFAVCRFPCWQEQISKKKGGINDIGLFCTPAEQEALARFGIKSILSIPIVNNDVVYGILVFVSGTAEKKWHDNHLKITTIMANFLGDAFAKIRYEKEINYMAFYDALTGLPNRFLFNRLLDQAITEAGQAHSKIAVIFIDLDAFKAVNDTMGHEGGDALLQQVAQSLSCYVGDRGVVARFGGDEFIIMLRGIMDSEQITQIAGEIMAVFKRPIKVLDQEFFVTASAGIAIYPEDGEKSNDLKKNADLAMYNAKELGKNQAAFCTVQMKAEIEKKVQLTNQLYRALEKNELVLYYQPFVSITTKEIIGVEALARWVHPELGLVPPSVFIPLAEQTGLINSIGRWVLETACRQNKKWQDAGYQPVRMAVNLSVEQFHNLNLVNEIRGVLEKTALAPQYLELEITESVAIKETDYISSVLKELKNLGVSIAIDDFGTEYSSLSRIKQLPIDRIKMAMQFVHGISVSRQDEAIAKIIINLANNLGVKVIAEGVETENQMRFLEKRICDEVQGFYFYKPMPAEELEKILRSKELVLL